MKNTLYGQADLQKLTKAMEKNQTFLVADHA
jgi:hypothetical protein